MHGSPPARRRLTRGMIFLLAAVGALGSMAIHMFVPAMPIVASDLHALPATVQLAVTLYLVGLGLGQLIAGPAADRLGRRPVLLTGLLLFVAGAVAAAATRDVTLLLAARLVQALGAAAGVVTTRAIVADLSERHEAASKLATLITVVLISPAASPLLGGAIAALGGWRAIFWVLAGCGVAGLLATLALIGETWRPDAARQAEKTVQAYARLLRNRRFLRYAGAIACSSCALYIFLSASSFLLIARYGLGPEEAGLCYFLVAGAGIAGTFAVGALEKRGGAFRWGLFGATLGGGLMLVAATLGFDGPVALMAPMVVMGLGTGIAAPAGVAGAMHAEEGLVGTGASLAGALQMMVSGLTTSLIAQAHLETLGAIAICIFAASLLGLFLAPPGQAIAPSA